ncbi:MAG: PrgI family protein [Coriobacteriaceae bacterium]|nr:PrgI family protein [Coriobacteriaceae bacterium]
MLTVAIHKDVTEYEPKVLGGFSLRTVVCLSVACIAAVVVTIIGFNANLDSAVLTPIIFIISAPACFMGFWQPYGMKFEKFLPLYLAHELGDTLVLYKSPSHRAEARAMNEGRARLMRETLSRTENKSYEKLRRRSGAEIWEPGGKLTAEAPEKGASNE